MKELDPTYFFRGEKIVPDDSSLAHILIDNGTNLVTIATPKGWKCKRKGCRTDYRHKHTTFASLK